MRRFDARSLWTATLRDGRWIWLALLLPVALCLPALPIDETRYLAVAWEMRLHGDFVVPHLNGATYSDKPPLLFWLINAVWSVFGLNVWSVRIGVLGTSAGSLLLFEHLIRRLDPDPLLARRATFILMGMVYFALFSSAIMFDVVLTTWVLIALHGAVDLDRQRWRRGVLLLCVGFGLGILTKGPVVLLDAGMVVLFGPLWSETARTAKLRWFGSLGLAIFGGAAIALAWAVPAAIAGGPDYANAIFLHQTIDRMSKSFAHRRPFWFYFMIIPFMILPWTIVARASWRAWRDSFHISKSIRFGVAWALPALLAFCLVSGKQPHYLLPLLGALALYLATVLGREGSRVDGRPFGFLLLLAGAALVALPYVAAHSGDNASIQSFVSRHDITPSTLTVIASAWPVWGICVLALAVALLFWKKFSRSLRAIALSCAAVAALLALALAQMMGPYIDVTAAAQRIKKIQDSGTPIAHLSWHHGLFEFAGRLTQPLPAVSFGELHEWSVAHPDGMVVSLYSRYPIPVQPESIIPYRFGRITFWRAADIARVELKPASRNEDDDSTDD